MSKSRTRCSNRAWTETDLAVLLDLSEGLNTNPNMNWPKVAAYLDRTDNVLSNTQGKGSRQRSKRHSFTQPYTEPRLPAGWIYDPTEQLKYWLARNPNTGLGRYPAHSKESDNAAAWREFYGISPAPQLDHERRVAALLRLGLSATTQAAQPELPPLTPITGDGTTSGASVAWGRQLPTPPASPHPDSRPAWVQVPIPEIRLTQEMTHKKAVSNTNTGQKSIGKEQDIAEMEKSIEENSPDPANAPLQIKIRMPRAQRIRIIMPPIVVTFNDISPADLLSLHVEDFMQFTANDLREIPAESLASLKRLHCILMPNSAIECLEAKDFDRFPEDFLLLLEAVKEKHLSERSREYIRLALSSKNVASEMGLFKEPQHRSTKRSREE